MIAALCSVELGLVLIAVALHCTLQFLLPLWQPSPTDDLNLDCSSMATMIRKGSGCELL